MKNIILIILLFISLIISIYYIGNFTKTKIAPYAINHYTDTINGHIILSTVCNYGDNISVSTLELNNNDTTNIK